MPQTMTKKQLAEAAKLRREIEKLSKRLFRLVKPTKEEISDNYDHYCDYSQGDLIEIITEDPYQASVDALEIRKLREEEGCPI